MANNDDFVLFCVLSYCTVNYNGEYLQLKRGSCVTRVRKAVLKALFPILAIDRAKRGLTLQFLVLEGTVVIILLNRRVTRWIQNINTSNIPTQHHLHFPTLQQPTTTHSSTIHAPLLARRYCRVTTGGPTPL